MKRLLFVCMLIVVTMMSCTDPMEDKLNGNGGIDGDPITIKG